MTSATYNLNSEPFNHFHVPYFQRGAFIQAIKKSRGGKQRRGKRYGEEQEMNRLKTGGSFVTTAMDSNGTCKAL